MGRTGGHAETDGHSNINDAAFFAIDGAFFRMVATFRAIAAVFPGIGAVFCGSVAAFPGSAAVRNGTHATFFAADGALHAIVGAPGGNDGAFWPVRPAKSRNDADIRAASPVTFDTRSFTRPWVQSCVAPFEVFRGSPLPAQSCAGTGTQPVFPMKWSRM